MKDEKFSVGCAVAYSAWVVAVGLFISVMIVGHADRLLALALLATAVAVTATVRTYFVMFSAMIRKAYELDRVTPMR